VDRNVYQAFLLTPDARKLLLLDITSLGDVSYAAYLRRTRPLAPHAADKDRKKEQHSSDALSGGSSGARFLATSRTSHHSFAGPRAPIAAKLAPISALPAPAAPPAPPVSPSLGNSSPLDPLRPPAVLVANTTTTAGTGNGTGSGSGSGAHHHHHHHPPGLFVHTGAAGSGAVAAPPAPAVIRPAPTSRVQKATSFRVGPLVARPSDTSSRARSDEHDIAEHA
jgi:hypothetical protein